MGDDDVGWAWKTPILCCSAQRSTQLTHLGKQIRWKIIQKLDKAPVARCQLLCLLELEGCSPEHAQSAMTVNNNFIRKSGRFYYAK